MRQSLNRREYRSSDTLSQYLSALSLALGAGFETDFVSDGFRQALKDLLVAQQNGLNAREPFRGLALELHELSIQSGHTFQEHRLVLNEQRHGLLKVVVLR